VRLLISVFLPVALLFTATANLILPVVDRVEPVPRAGLPAVVDVNRPQTPEQCDLPIGISWFGSSERCLAELCGGRNVYNEYIFDGANRRRRNPCYGQSPTDFEGR